MRPPSGPESRGPGPTVLPAVSAPVPVLVARSGTVDISSLSPGMVALAVGLVLSFLAPVAVSALLITTDERTAGNEHPTTDHRGTDSERSTDDTHAATGNRNGPPSETHTEQQIDTRQEGTRPRAERSDR